MPASTGCTRTVDNIARRDVAAQPAPSKVRTSHGRFDLLRILLGFFALVALNGTGLSDQPLEIKIGYLRQAPSRIRISLIEKSLGENDDPVAAMNALAEQGASFIVTSLDADRLLKAADAGKMRGETLINALATDERLREQDCRANVFHVAPTRSMLADALAQYLAWKQWKRWLLVVGSHDKDVLFADALRRAAARFGARIVQERTFEDTGGA